MRFTVIIPARYASNRLPAKPLADINGKPMVVHVLERALVSGAERVIVATDHMDILDTVKKVRGEVCFTRSDHQSGTERLSEVIENYGFEDNDIIVNVQGDEPLIPPCIIHQVADNLIKCKAEMATLAVPIHHIEEIFNPHVVKVSVDSYGYALYFSRAPIPKVFEMSALLNSDMYSYQESSLCPYASDYINWISTGRNLKDFRYRSARKIYSTSKNVGIEKQFLRHIGIYAYRAGFIRRYVGWAPCEWEKIESLEQLRVLSHYEKIHVALAKEIPAIGIDTLEDLQNVRYFLNSS